MTSDLFSLIFITALLILIVVLFIRIAIRIRKHGGSLTTLMFGSTYEFYNKDKRKAIEQLVETKANKKMEEESTDKPQEV
ncbi:MAG: hypothetical protein AB1521_09510 [Bacteroidota bacterium]